MSDNDSPDHREPRRIGPYTLLRTLGEGGMGVVYEATQSEPIRRRVALKLIRGELSSPEITARFEAERQALAVMEHPGIAKVLDAGMTEGGTPYFVMEFVDGVPITEYADARCLSVRERVRLFLGVCGAVRHAHQKGVIHRDLKPSNVLVTEQAGEAAPRVIDFGIAKAVGITLTEKTLETRHIVGTPAYMSPEQAEASHLDVDTRSDIYSLGVMLYELLSGRLPVDPDELGLLRFLASLVARDTAPPTPSARVAEPGPLGPEVAARRATDRAGLRRDLKGDLDWIVMKALEADRERRYETVNALALDLERYLRDEPVFARPPSTGYRVRKFARRNRAAVTAAAFAVLALVAGLVASAVGLLQARDERDRANRELAKAEGVNRFMQEWILSSDPVEGLGPDASVLEALDYSSSYIDTVLAGPEMVPEVEASIRDAIGWSYFKLGQASRATSFLERALATRREILGDEAEETAQSSMRLGQAYAELGRFDEADSLFVAARRSLSAAMGDEHEAVAHPIKHRGALMRELGRNDEARALLAEALERFTRVDSSSLETAELLGHLGTLDYQEEAFESARDRFARQLSIRGRSLEASHPLVLESRNNLAAALEQLGDAESAEGEYRAVIAALEAAGQGRETDITPTMGNLALLLEQRGENEEAETLYRTALEIRDEKLPRPHEERAGARVNYGVFLCFQERFDAGAGLLREAVQELEAYFGGPHWASGNATYWLGDCLVRAGDVEEGERLLVQALSVLTETLGEDHARTVRARDRLAELYETRGRPEEAENYGGGRSADGTPFGGRARHPEQRPALAVSPRARLRAPTATGSPGRRAGGGRAPAAGFPGTSGPTGARAGSAPRRTSGTRPDPRTRPRARARSTGSSRATPGIGAPRPRGSGDPPPSR